MKNDTCNRLDRLEESFGRLLSSGCDGRTHPKFLNPQLLLTAWLEIQLQAKLDFTARDGNAIANEVARSSDRSTILIE